MESRLQHRHSITEKNKNFSREPAYEHQTSASLLSKGRTPSRRSYLLFFAGLWPAKNSKFTAFQKNPQEEHNCTATKKSAKDLGEGDLLHSLDCSIAWSRGDGCATAPGVTFCCRLHYVICSLLHLQDGSFRDYILVYSMQFQYCLAQNTSLGLTCGASLRPPHLHFSQCREFLKPSSVGMSGPSRAHTWRSCAPIYTNSHPNNLVK